MKAIQKLKDLDIKAPPARKTRIRDGITVPEDPVFEKAYSAVRNAIIPSKTKEISFQILNRTLWTNNKAFKTGLMDDSNCPYCGEVETIEHLVLNCDNYSYPLWHMAGKALTEIFGRLKGGEGALDMGSINLTYRNILYHEIPYGVSNGRPTRRERDLYLLIVMEIKRDIYYRKVANTPSTIGMVPALNRAMHLVHLLKKIKSYLQYISAHIWKDAIMAIQHSLNSLMDPNNHIADV